MTNGKGNYISRHVQTVVEKKRFGEQVKQRVKGFGGIEGIIMNIDVNIVSIYNGSACRKI